MVEFSSEPEYYEELIFGFTEEFIGEGSSCSSSSTSTSAVEFDDGAITDEENEDEISSVTAEEESKAFWNSQEDLLTTTLFRTTSLESKIRQATKEAMKEMNLGGFISCVCDNKMGGNKSCRNCFHKEISGRLRMEGYNCNICKSKWKKSSDIPSGEHTYLEVVHNTSSGGKGGMKIIIEPNFRAQFEMAKASDEYKKLINKLPEVFVGKFSRLQNSVKIICAGLKKSVKEKKMHMAPWRKHKYMLSKWQGSPDDNNSYYGQYQMKLMPNSSPVISNLGTSTSRPRASMLTFDLLDTLRVIPSSTMIRVG